MTRHGAKAHMCEPMVYYSAKWLLISKLAVLYWKKPHHSQNLSPPFSIYGPRTLVEIKLQASRHNVCRSSHTPNSPFMCRILHEAVTGGSKELQPFSAFNSIPLLGSSRLIGFRAKVGSSRTTLREVTGENGVDEGAED